MKLTDKLTLITGAGNNIVAMASDAEVDSPLPRYSLNDIDGIARFILNHTGLA